MAVFVLLFSLAAAAEFLSLIFVESQLASHTVSLQQFPVMLQCFFYRLYLNLLYMKMITRDILAISVLRRNVTIS